MPRPVSELNPKDSHLLVAILRTVRQFPWVNRKFVENAIPHKKQTISRIIDNLIKTKWLEEKEEKKQVRDFVREQKSLRLTMKGKEQLDKVEGFV